MKIPKFKVVLLGDRWVGKKAIFNRFVYDLFQGPISRRGIEVHEKCFTINEEEVRLLLWYPFSIRLIFNAHTYFRAISGLILAYDITKENTLYNLKGLLETYQEYLGRLDFPILLIGCKADLEENRKVSKEEALEFAKKNNLEIEDVIECSAKTGENVKLVFTTLAKEIKERLRETERTEEKELIK